MSNDKENDPLKVESKFAAAFGTVLNSFTASFLNFFDSSLRTFMESRQLHIQQQNAIKEYTDFLKSQLKHSLGLWPLLLDAYSLFLARSKQLETIPDQVDDKK